MDFLLSLLGHAFGGLWQYIVGGVGIAIAGIALYFKGKADQEKKGQIATQKATVDAYKERTEVDDAIAGATPDERKRLRDKWSRD